MNTTKSGLFTVGALLGALVLLSAACQGQPSAEPTVTPSTVAAGPTATSVPCPVQRGEQVVGFVAELILDGGRTEFAQGDPITMRLSISNCSEGPLRRVYSSGQGFDFIVSDAHGAEIWRWSYDKVFAQAIQERTFNPGETVTYEEVWNQRNTSKEQVEPGRYDILGIDVGCEEPNGGCRFGMGLLVEITP